MVEDSQVQAQNEQKTKVLEQMRLSSAKFTEFSESLFDLEFGSREEWQR